MEPSGSLAPIVRHGENSIVLKENDAAELAYVLHQLYSDLPMMLKLQHAALHSRQSSYTVDQMVDHYEKLLREVAQEVRADDWERPKPFVWSPHFGDALPPQDLIYPHEALRARKELAA
jgi:hypothetical protein